MPILLSRANGAFHRRVLALLRAPDHHDTAVTSSPSMIGHTIVRRGRGRSRPWCRGIILKRWPHLRFAPRWRRVHGGPRGRRQRQALMPCLRRRAQCVSARTPNVIPGSARPVRICVASRVDKVVHWSSRDRPRHGEGAAGAAGP